MKRKELKTKIETSMIDKSLIWNFTACLNALRRAKVLYIEYDKGYTYTDDSEIYFTDEYKDIPTNELEDELKSKKGIGEKRIRYCIQIIKCLRNEAVEVFNMNMEEQKKEEIDFDLLIDDRLEKLIHEAHYGHTERMFMLIGSLEVLQILRGVE